MNHPAIVQEMPAAEPEPEDAEQTDWLRILYTQGLAINSGFVFV